MDERRPIALVTGGTAGLGRSIAEALRRDGFMVAVCARREDKLEAMAGHGFATFRCDVAEAGEVERLCRWMSERFGRLDALVNCAAVALARAEFQSQDLAEVRRLVSVNLLGTMSVTQAALPLLAKHGGSIVNFSSTLAQRPRAGSVAYSAAKGGIEAFTKALAVEVAKANVRVNCVAPSLVRSEIWIAAGMSEADYAKLLASRAQEVPLGRVGEPEDVAELVAFLVSPRAAWLTGVCVPVDGGALLR
jgi:NAD(P)-dependent dehydrogenase (short-subunit alcohol dehydrogenase family)